MANTQNIQIYLEPGEVNENEYFKVSAYIINESQEIEFLKNVNITFNNQTYIITDENDNYEVKIKAPSVNNTKTYIIYATKQGYEANYTQITVKNVKQSLKIIPQDYIIPAGDYFYVTVYDNNKDENPIEGANVYISNYGDKMEITKEDGKAYFYAPKDREEIKIIACKSDYTNSNLTIKLKPQPNIISQIIHNKTFIIFISFIILIFVIIFVHYRQKKNIYMHAKQISDQKTLEEYTSEPDNFYDNNRAASEGFVRSPVGANQSKDSKVEEIRIHRPNKEKEIVGINTNEKNGGNISNSKINNRRNNEWFEGIDQIRYEIDKLTGQIDEKGKDKWFEGVDDFKRKIDDNIKKKNKKTK